jgi:hypothetical protein
MSNINFWDEHTSTQYIYAAGWRLQRSQKGGWWWEMRHENGVVDKMLPPLWVVELQQDAVRRGREEIRSSIRNVIGVKNEY